MIHLLHWLVAFATASTTLTALATRLPTSWRNWIATAILTEATAKVDAADARARRLIEAAKAIAPDLEGDRHD